MDYSNDAPQPAAPQFCEVCGTEILTMTWKNTGVCGDQHRKERGTDVILGEDKGGAPRALAP